MPLPPSRRDVNAPPKRDLSSLASHVRHHDSYLRSLDPGMLDGRFRTPQPFTPGSPTLVGGADNGGDGTTYEWQWDDRGTAKAAGTQVFTLTYEPVEESLFVRWHPGGIANAGLPVTNERLSVNGRQVSIADSGFYAANDAFSFQYQFDPALAVEPASVLFVGKTEVLAGTTSIALPAGTQVGDLLIFGAAAAALCSTTDPRMNTVYTPSGGGGCVAYGITGSATAPVACSIDGGTFNRAAAVVAVYRGVTVDSWASQDSSTNDITLPVLPDAFAAVGVLLNWEGVVHGSINYDTTGAWTQDSQASATKNNVAVESWSTDEQTSTPAGAFHHGGDWAGFSATTLRLVGTA